MEPGKKFVTVDMLVKAGYASHSLDVATQHDISAWRTSGLRRSLLQPNSPVKVTERLLKGQTVSFGRTLTYPPEQ